VFVIAILISCAKSLKSGESESRPSRRAHRCSVSRRDSVSLECLTVKTISLPLLCQALVGVGGWAGGGAGSSREALTPGPIHADTVSRSRSSFSPLLLDEKGAGDRRLPRHAGTGSPNPRPLHPWWPYWRRGGDCDPPHPPTGSTLSPPRGAPSSSAGASVPEMALRSPTFRRSFSVVSSRRTPLRRLGAPAGRGRAAGGCLGVFATVRARETSAGRRRFEEPRPRSGGEAPAQTATFTSTSTAGDAAKGGDASIRGPWGCFHPRGGVRSTRYSLVKNIHSLTIRREAGGVFDPRGGCPPPTSATRTDEKPGEWYALAASGACAVQMTTVR
jgi:hypothetical protein